MTGIRFQAIFVFVSGLIIFTFGLGHQEIIGFESRFYLFALEMWRHGPTWFPTTYQQPYADYPATFTYLIYLFAKLVGGLNKFSAVIPVALASAFTLAVTYLIGTLYNRRWGGYAVLFLLFTAPFLTEARSVSLDPFTMAITSLCFYLICSAQVLNKSYRVCWVFPLFILGFAFRGPLGLVIPTGVTCVFYLLEKDFRRFFIIGVISAALLTICCAAMFGLAYHVGGWDFLQDVLRMQVLGRMQHEVKTLPAYFYFVDSLGSYAITFPLAILVILGSVVNKMNSSRGWSFVKLEGHPNSSAQVKFLQKLLGWVLIILIGLSIPGDKKIRYILPMAPALALICAYLFVGTDKLYYLRKAFYWICFFFPVLCFIAVILIHLRYPNFNFTYYNILILFSIIQMMMLWMRKKEWLVVGFAVLTFVASNILVIERINIDLNLTSDFVHQVEQLRLTKHADLVFYREKMDGLPIKYIINMSREERPLFIKRDFDFKKIKSPSFVIMTADNVKTFPKKEYSQKVLDGKIGRKEVVVMEFDGQASTPALLQ